jgi:undecaprenyl diphosphate synthase
MAAVAPSPDISVLRARLDPTRLPCHVAIITDGNGRWARGRGLPRIEGHRCGYKTVRQIVRDAGDLGIAVLTLYVFSVENWKRSKQETDALMVLIEQAARNELRELHENNVRIRFVGRRDNLPASLQREMDRDVAWTAGNTGLILNLAINYGGRAEIVDAAKAIAAKIAAGDLKGDDIDEALMTAHMYAPDLPDPDLVIRTAGEMRLSNFLLWGSAYAEFWNTPTLWPDFNASLLTEAILDYQSRVRKFGNASET